MNATTDRPAVNMDAIANETRRRCRQYHTGAGTPMSPAQIEAAALLAADLYSTAAHHGISPDVADNVTSFISAAIDAVKLRPVISS